MKKTIYIHIGSPKTGTTTIQNYLSENFNKLLTKYKILYPLSGRNFISHHPLAADLRKKYLGAKIAKHCYGDVIPDVTWGNLKKELIENYDKFDSVVISSEDFFLFSKEEMIKEIKESFNDFNIKVIVYLRRQDKLINSLYNQAIKCTLQNDLELSVFMKKHHILKMDYDSRLSLWASVIGKENIILRSFERNKLINYDAVCDFCSIIGVSNEGASNEEKNNALSIEELVIKNELNKCFDDNMACIKCFDKIRPDASKKNNIVIFSKEQYENISHSSIKINTILSNKYFNGEKIFNDFEPYENFSVYSVNYDILKENIISVCNLKNKEILNKDELNKVRKAVKLVLNKYDLNFTLLDKLKIKFF